MALKLYRGLVPGTAVEWSKGLEPERLISYVFPMFSFVCQRVLSCCSALSLSRSLCVSVLSGIPLIGTDFLYLAIFLTATSDRAGNRGCGMGVRRRFRLVLYLTWFAGA